MKGNIIKGLHASFVECVHGLADIGHHLDVFVGQNGKHYQPSIHSSNIVNVHVSTYVG